MPWVVEALPSSGSVSHMCGVTKKAGSLGSSVWAHLAALQLKARSNGCVLLAIRRVLSVLISVEVVLRV